MKRKKKKHERYVGEYEMKGCECEDKKVFIEKVRDKEES